MIFLGNSFFSGKNTLYPSPVEESKITSVSLSDGTYNHLFISKNTELTTNAWTDDWDFDTVLNASFDTNLDAGNSGFSLRNTDNIVITRREKLTGKTVTIYVKPITVIEDFDVNILHRFARSETDYIFRISSYMNGIENSYVEVEVRSEFEGMFICYKDSMYGTIYDLDGADTTQNIKSSVVEGYGKYPTVISNSETNYEKGSVIGSFIKVDDNECKVDLESGRIYRQEFKNQLASKKPFIFKMPDGRAWMACCTDTPSDSMKEHRDLRQITFSFCEIGDLDDMETLYYNNLSDVESRWW